MISNFEKALRRNEFPAYFRGSGIYFTRDPDWGTQLHAINWSGLCGFLKLQKDPTALLKDAFEKYVLSIEETREEASDLLENIICYYHMRKKVPELSENGFDLIRDLGTDEKKIVSSVMRLLKQEIGRSNSAQDVENYNLNISKLIRDGGPENIENL
ncbi:hypothetical protein K5D33_25280 [Pseudomonas cichorii]|nr:hypothetical protein [Pseudomonas cichorii]MBX8538019.1 hypothetical protein [Pseudomonas cichorii]